MKSFYYLICILLLIACKSNTKSTATDSLKSAVVAVDSLKRSSKPNTITPYRLNDDYMVVDTGEYSNGPMGGYYAIIKRGGIIADTIDLSYGIKILGAQVYFYETLKKVPADEPGSESGKSLSLDFSDYLLITNSQKTSLKTLAPSFDDYFSSPGVINNKIYYWQIDKQQSDNKISAAEYDPASKSTKSFYLFNDGVETDDSGYFPNPYLKNDTIYFDNGNEKVKKFSKDFKPYN